MPPPKAPHQAGGNRALCQETVTNERQGVMHRARRPEGRGRARRHTSFRSVLTPMRPGMPSTPTQEGGMHAHGHILRRPACLDLASHRSHGGMRSSTGRTATTTARGGGRAHKPSHAPSRRWWMASYTPSPHLRTTWNKSPAPIDGRGRIQQGPPGTMVWPPCYPRQQGGLAGRVQRERDDLPPPPRPPGTPPGSTVETMALAQERLVEECGEPPLGRPAAWDQGMPGGEDGTANFPCFPHLMTSQPPHPPTWTS